MSCKLIVMSHIVVSQSFIYSSFPRKFISKLGGDSKFGREGRVPAIPGWFFSVIVVFFKCPLALPVPALFLCFYIHFLIIYFCFKSSISLAQVYEAWQGSVSSHPVPAPAILRQTSVTSRRVERRSSHWRQFLVITRPQHGNKVTSRFN